MDAVSKFVLRYASFARELAKDETSEQRKNELTEIAKNCEWLAYNPPETFWQAMQLIHFNFIIPTVASNQVGTQVGRLDQDLIRFFRKDTEEGLLSHETALDILENWFCILNTDLYVFLDEDVASRNAMFPQGGVPTVGGQTRDGFDATNELSYMVLEAERNTRNPGPDIAVRIHRNTPDDFLREVCKTISIGTGKPKLFMDESWYQRGMAKGYPIEEIRDYQGAFCAESSLSGQIYWVPENAQVMGGFGLYIDLAMHDGWSHFFGMQLGEKTGDARNFTSFDEVYDAVRRQAEYIVKKILPARQTIARAPGELVPDSFISAVMDDCLEKGIGWEKGGARYNTFGFNTVGNSVGGNSLMAIKRVVFEDRKITMRELVDALASNYEGPRGEEIRLMMKSAPKFGNDNDEVDLLTKNIMEMDIAEYQKYRGPQGGYGVGTFDAVTAHIGFGSVVWATPDGRKAGDPLNEGGVSPYQGTDKQGPTASIKSVAKLPWTNPNAYGGVFNMWIDPKNLQTDEEIEKFMALVRTYNTLGGQEIQFNCIGSDTLRHAQDHPEGYDNLIVRVAGYSSYYTGLARDVQDDILERTEQHI
jgi:formate C-acetyltransferase